MKLREALKEYLTEKELHLLKASFDTIGSIAIVEILKELEKKERIIAETLMKNSSNITTVVKKIGIRKGELRLQKYKVICGINTKETIHTESGAKIKLNIEDVYYSVRLSTERLRISQQIQNGEGVLIMFSGCAPYPCVLAKNSKAKIVYGIELNKKGHEYGLENIRLNKLNNVFLIQGDVKKVVPEFTRYIVGLKCGTEPKRILKTLKEKPKIIELYLEFEECMDTAKLDKLVDKLTKKGIEIVLHAPWHEKIKQEKETTKESASLAVQGQRIGKNLFMLSKLGKIAKKYNLKVIVHPANEYESTEQHKKTMLENLPKLQEYFKWFYFENICRSCFKSLEDIKEAVEKYGIKNICIDTCHLYEDFKDNKMILWMLEELSKMPVGLYFHLADADGKVHALEAGKGKVDFEKVIPFLTIGVAEINCKDYLNPAEMARSRETLGKMKKKFDRIAMPLPKGAESFLDTALDAIKKDGIIHFYDFSHENEMPDSSFEKIEKACKKAGKKYKIISWNKCGDYAPGKFRLCVDFKVLN